MAMRIVYFLHIGLDALENDPPVVCSLLPRVACAEQYGGLLENDEWGKFPARCPEIAPVTKNALSCVP